MGQLVRYLQGLNQNDPIDDDIAHLSTLSKAFIRWSNNWGHARIANGKYNCVYVPWAQGRICYAEADANQDILSFPFLGCYLARISRSNGNYYCYHIHSERNYLQRDQKENWNNHISYLQTKVNRHGSLFRPSKDFFNNPPENCELWGIIASNGDCYSVLVHTEGSPHNPSVKFNAIVYQGRYATLTIP